MVTATVSFADLRYSAFDIAAFDAFFRQEFAARVAAAALVDPIDIIIVSVLPTLSNLAILPNLTNPTDDDRSVDVVFSVAFRDASLPGNPAVAADAATFVTAFTEAPDEIFALSALRSFGPVSAVAEAETWLTVRTGAPTPASNPPARRAPREWILPLSLLSLLWPWPAAGARAAASAAVAGAANLAGVAPLPEAPSGAAVTPGEGSSPPARDGWFINWWDGQSARVADEPAPPAGGGWFANWWRRSDEPIRADGAFQTPSGQPVGATLPTSIGTGTASPPAAEPLTLVGEALMGATAPAATWPPPPSPPPLPPLPPLPAVLPQSGDALQDAIADYINHYIAEFNAGAKPLNCPLRSAQQPHALYTPSDPF
eukprot:252921-Prorocentrum_minimum.AAC.4